MNNLLACPQLVCPTCNTPIDSHPASRCLDAWIAKEVMGLGLPKNKLSWHKANDGIGWKAERPDYSTDGTWLRSWSYVEWPPNYSTSIYCAWQVLEEMKEEWFREVHSVGYNTGWEAELELMIHYGPTYKGYGKTAELAICIAALKATDALKTLKAKTWDEIFSWVMNRGLLDSYAKELADEWKA